MCIRIVDAGGGDVVGLLAVSRLGLGEVDDLEDLGPAEAGDLHSSPVGEPMGPNPRRFPAR